MSLAALALVSRTALASQLNNWQVLPRPERFTQLYFTDYRKLSSSLSTKPQQVSFTVQNFEHQTTTYHYSLIAKSGDSGEQESLGEGDFTLASSQVLVTNRNLLIPPLSSRVAVEVELSYSGVAFGKRTASPEAQSIDYWVNVASNLLAVKAKS